MTKEVDSVEDVLEWRKSYDGACHVIFVAIKQLKRIGLVDSDIYEIVQRAMERIEEK